MQLKVYIQEDEEGWFIAECPALPGCVSQGRTEEEAVNNIVDAIRGWLHVEEEKALEANKPAPHTRLIPVNV